ncbi:nitroreductase family protein [Hespellia stercorisuis]|uniref:Nitroreductase n=1 Tax=Hespellia stercorisuis DSM 15480 TaxID=1121950 RepID=A0A1M6UTM8_9FIRM|nr:nitroreductase family protein [Hespellia stercorisuis]SHK72503.1 Nitroreductase [Hespellia stercorisuis DSM 15480]
MNLQEAMENIRSIRKYKHQAVNEQDIRAIIEAAILAPSWKNAQEPRYRIIRSPEMLQKVRETLPAFNQKNVQDAPVLIVTSIVKNRAGFDRNGTPDNELGNGWGYYDCGLSSMNLLLKAQELGLSTLVMGIRDADMLQEILQIPAEEAVVSVIGLGYGDIEPDMPKRKTVDEVSLFY